MFLYFSPKIFVDDCITQGNATRKYIKESRRLVRFLTSMIYYFRGTKRCIEIFLVTRKNDCWNLCRIFDRVQRWDICVLTLRGTCWIAEQVPLHLPAWKHSIELPLSPSLYSSPSPLRPFFIFFFFISSFKGEVILHQATSECGIDDGWQPVRARNGKRNFAYRRWTCYTVSVTFIFNCLLHLQLVNTGR